jgi:hypothetical protein
MQGVKRVHSGILPDHPAPLGIEHKVSAKYPKSYNQRLSTQQSALSHATPLVVLPSAFLESVKTLQLHAVKSALRDMHINQDLSPLSTTDEQGNTPIMIAIQKGNYAIFLELLKFGGHSRDLRKARNQQGHTAFSICLSNYHRSPIFKKMLYALFSDIFNQLEQNPDFLYAVYELQKNLNPLDALANLAVVFELKNVIDTLLNFLSSEPKNSACLKEIADNDDQFEFSKIFLASYCAPIELWKLPELVDAVQKRKARLVELLLLCKVDANSTNNHQAALCAACQKEVEANHDLPIIELLLAAGANINESLMISDHRELNEESDPSEKFPPLFFLINHCQKRDDIEALKLLAKYSPDYFLRVQRSQNTNNQETTIFYETSISHAVDNQTKFNIDCLKYLLLKMIQLKQKNLDAFKIILRDEMLSWVIKSDGENNPDREEDVQLQVKKLKLLFAAGGDPKPDQATEEAFQSEMEEINFIEGARVYFEAYLAATPTTIKHRLIKQEMKLMKMNMHPEECTADALQESLKEILAIYSKNSAEISEDMDRNIAQACIDAFCTRYKMAPTIKDAQDLINFIQSFPKGHRLRIALQEILEPLHAKWTKAINDLIAKQGSLLTSFKNHEKNSGKSFFLIQQKLHELYIQPTFDFDYPFEDFPESLQTISFQHLKRLCAAIEKTIF